MTTKQEKGGLEYDFDESILQPTGEEIVRVVYTQPKREGCLRDFCREHGIVCYLPLRKVCRLIRKGYKEKSYQYQAVVLRPMFPNYAFLRLNPSQRSEIFRSRAVVRILGDAKLDQRRLLDEIRLVRRIETIAMTEAVEFNAEIREGDKFLIESGPWQGVCGWLRKKEKRSLWTVEIECVNTLIQATIDPAHCRMTPVVETT